MSQLLSKKTKAIILIILSIYSPFLIGLSFQRSSAIESDLIFKSNSSITYELNYTINFQSYYRFPLSFELWFARIENWTSDQNSEIISRINPDNVKNHTIDEFDIYNNSYENYYKELEGQNGDQSFNLTLQYEITSTGNQYEIPDNLTLDNYDKNSNLYQFYTSYQPYVEINDTNIISTALSETDGMTSLNEMIEAIYLYVVENIKYNDEMDGAIGAAEALSTKSGDCSEFSSLMVALLRTIGIPARKVIGIALINEDQTAKYDVKVGDVWSYPSGENNIPGHAWVQYYVPEIGWVSADPTWGNSLYEAEASERYILQYLNQMDYVHLITSVGDYYGSGIEPPLPLDYNEEGTPELNFYYAMLNASISQFYYDFSITYDFKCIEVNLSEDPNIEIPDMYIIIGIGGGFFLLFALIGIASIKKSKNNKKEYYR